MSDDEQERVQAEIDTAIASLQNHMEVVSGEPASREDAAIAIHNYSTPQSVLGQQISLGKAVDNAISARRRYQAMGKTAKQEYKTGQAKLLPALAALAEWSDFDGQALRHEHMAALWESAFCYIQGMTRFFGQENGIELRGKRDIDLRLRDRVFAAAAVLKLNKEDPDQYPITQDTFDRIGPLYGLSGSRVRDFFYSKEGKRILPALRDI
jgi:hypothetical protein